MKLKKIAGVFSLCKLDPCSKIDLEGDFLFVGKTDEELSLVCPSELVPDSVFCQDDGWKAFRIEGVLDFSLIGILSGITTILAGEKIGIFAISTYNTDYILVKENDYERALHALAECGYDIIP